MTKTPPSSWRPLLLAGAFCLCLCCGLLGASYALADDPVLVPEAPGSISGVVTDGNGTPLPGIEVSIYQTIYGSPNVIRSLTTDATGTYKAAALATGIYNIRFHDPQGTHATEYYGNAVTFDSATEVPVAGNDITGINIQLALGGGISGAVHVTETLNAVACALCGNLSVLHQNNGKWQIATTTPISVPLSFYQVTGLPVGIYRVCISPFGESPYTTLTAGECYDNVASGVDNAQDVAVTAGQITPNINFALGDDADLATIGGQVTSATGSPLAKIMVDVQPWSDFSAQHRIGYSGAGGSSQTDSAGFYRVRGLYPGTYVIWFSDPHGLYVNQFYGNTDLFNFADRITLALKEQRLDVNASLARGAQITGTVTLLHQPPGLGASVLFYKSVNPPADFPFTVDFRAAVDPQSGVYASKGLPPGEYRVFASVQAASTKIVYGYYGGADYTHATKLVLSSGEVRSNIDINISNATIFDGRIAGQVSAAGLPQAGIKVSLFQDLHPAVDLFYTYTNVSGYYAIDGLVDGSYFLGFSDLSGVYATTYYPNQPSLQTALSLTIVNSRPISNANVALARAGSISGRVTLYNGKPLAGVSVTILDDSSFTASYPEVSLTTDANGEYKGQGLWPGNHKVCFTYVTLTSRQNACYGDSPPFSPLLTATNVFVSAGVETKGIDMVFGSAGPGRLYLPQIAR